MSRSQTAIMNASGYVSAAQATKAIGFTSVSTIHRKVRTGKLRGLTADHALYVSVASLLEAYADCPPILASIRALGVDPMAG